MTNKNNIKAVRKSRAVAVFNITEQDALGFVAVALGARGLLTLTNHARTEMANDNISLTQIRGVLKQGQIREAPCRDAAGRWNCRFEGYVAGQGIAVVVGFDCREDGTIVPVVTTFTLDNYRR